MKKFISVLLVAVMCFSLVFPAFADSRKNATIGIDVPVIYISGDSIPIEYDNGQKTFEIDDFLDLFSSDDGDSSNTLEATVNILKPLIIEGILFDEWDNYYDAMYKELSDATKPILLDGNGNSDGTSGITAQQKKKMDYSRAHDMAKKNKDGLYWSHDYEFFYDWRLDPLESVDDLHSFIQDIKAVTGKDKVCIIAKCLGCNVLLSYIYKYGTNDLKGVGIDVATSMGADFLSGMLSGDFGIDGNSIGRFAQSVAYASDNYTELADFGAAIFSMLDDTGVLDGMSDKLRENFYSKIEYGIISAIARATFLTFPGYWGMITCEKFDDALRYVYGEEGSDLREEYAGLIEKASFFNENLKKNVLSIFGSLSENNVNVAVISKYGIQMVPVLKDGSLIGDEYVSVTHSSLGAVTSDVYGTLSDEYIAERKALGLGKYISPDKQIDASTCLFPDSTWFFKGVQHGFSSSAECDIMMKVMGADRQLTVDDFELGRFVVYHQKQGIAENMTEENCNIYWTADYTEDNPKTEAEKKFSLIKNAIELLKSFISLISHYLTQLFDKAA